MIFKILAKISAFLAGVLLLIGSVDKLFFRHSNIFPFMQHESYFLAANPFILLAILLYIVYAVDKKDS